eukprot:12054307-Prorocentrum_lima.AAC.1
MTSSLVGSEMCIRDSCFPSAVADSVGHASNATLQSKHNNPCGVTTPAPVSYTHLTLPTICSV